MKTMFIALLCLFLVACTTPTGFGGSNTVANYTGRDFTKADPNEGYPSSGQFEFGGHGDGADGGQGLE